MPIYEYRCADCRAPRERLFPNVFGGQHGHADLRALRLDNLSRLVSRVFQLKSEDAQLEDMTDPSSFGDLDENDPKSVARWARKLGQQMGEDLGDDWGEMVDRLEAGEDLGDEAGDGADLGGVGADSDSSDF